MEEIPQPPALKTYFLPLIEPSMYVNTQIPGNLFKLVIFYFMFTFYGYLDCTKNTVNGGIYSVLH